MIIKDNETPIFHYDISVVTRFAGYAILLCV